MILSRCSNLWNSSLQGSDDGTQLSETIKTMDTVQKRLFN